MTAGESHGSVEQVEGKSRVLVLCTAISARVLAVGSRLASSHPDSEVVVGVPEVETWKFRDSGLQILVSGDAQLPFRSQRFRRLIEDQQFDEVHLPLGVPRSPPLDAARLVISMKPQSFSIDAAWFRVGWRPAVVATLAVFHVVVWIPFKILERACAVLDGICVILGGALARLKRGRRRRGTSATICHVLPSLGTGGVQKQVIEYLKRAKNGSPLALIVLFDHNDRFLLDIEAAGLDFEILARKCRRGLLGRLSIRLLPNTTAMAGLVRRLREIDPSCVVSWLFQANVVAAPAACLAEVPCTVTSIRNLSTWKIWRGYRKWWYRTADRNAASLSDRIFSNSRAAAEDYVRWLRRDSIAAEVIANGLDIEAFLRAPRTDIRSLLGIPDDRKTLLAVGRLTTEKDQATLFEALTHLTSRCPAWHLVLVGHGRLEPRLRELAERLGLSERVTFVGRVDDPQSYYAASDLFVLPSRIEGLPNALIEAQAFGLAIVTTDWPGSSEVVAPGETAAVVPIGDAAAMAREIERLLVDDELRSEMGRRAEIECRRRFDIDKMVAAVDRISGRVES